MRAQASFSRCGRYRWWLSRRWRDDAPTLLFLGLNPSRADAQRDDPTLRRLIGFADSWGYGAIEVLNLFAWISTDPAALRRAAEPVGRRNDAWIQRRVRQLARGSQASSSQAGRIRHYSLSSDNATPVLVTPFNTTPFHATSGCRRDRLGERSAGRHAPEESLPLWLGWGNGGRWCGRDQQLLTLLSPLPVRLLCLGHTACGQPRHPLYLGGGSPLRPFASSWGQDSAAPAAPCPASRAATRST